MRMTSFSAAMASATAPMTISAYGSGAPTRPRVAVGPGRFDDNSARVPIDVSVGDVVLYSKYGGTEVKYSGDEFLILSARDVLAVVS